MSTTSRRKPLRFTAPELQEAMVHAMNDIKWWMYFGTDHGSPPKKLFEEPWTEALAEDLTKFTLKRLRRAQENTDATAR